MQLAMRLCSYAVNAINADAMRAISVYAVMQLTPMQLMHLQY